MKQRACFGVARESEREISWYRKRDFQRPVGSPSWQARIHLDQWSARQDCGSGEANLKLALRRLAGNCV